MHPRKIAEFIHEDIKPGTLGLCEDLYGHRIIPGEKPIDLLINYVDKAYIDFNPEDNKFKAAAIKVFGKYPDPGEWRQLIMQSSQSDELKNKLLTVVGAGSAPTPTSVPTSGKYTITTRRGKQIVADMIKKVTGYKGGEFYYIGIEPTRLRIFVNSQTRYVKRQAPEIYEPTTRQLRRPVKTVHDPTRVIQLYQTILTINPQNIVKIERA
jgi:hypothetical protein